MSDSPAEEERAHDILAAEAFAVPAPDPALRHDPVVVPEDPTGIVEAHDILAAEDFAMPAARPTHARRLQTRPRPSQARLLAGALLLLALVAMLRRRRAR